MADEGNVYRLCPKGLNVGITELVGREHLDGKLVIYIDPVVNDGEEAPQGIIMLPDTVDRLVELLITHAKTVRQMQDDRDRSLPSDAVYEGKH